MVRMRYLSIVSLCIHGLLAFSIGQYIHNSQQQEPQHFSVILLTSSKGASEQVQVVHKKIVYNKVRTKSGAVSDQSITEAPFVPSVMYNPAPAYPASAKTNGHEGEFSIKLLVNSAGNVERVEVIPIKGDKEPFEEELLKTLKTWKFSPGSKEVSFEIPISFRLD